MYRLNSEAWFNESKAFISSLAPASNKRVKKVCPLCKTEKETAFCHITECGHTYCRRCKASMTNMQSVMGQRFGELTVVDFGKPLTTKDGKNLSRVRCKCSCGKVKLFLVSRLKNGDYVSCGCRKKLTGEAHSSFKKDIPASKRKKYREHRKDSASVIWKTAVKQKYGNTCVKCGSKQKLVAHHLESFADNENLRFDVNNGVCLCEVCHVEYHTKFLGNYRIRATKKSFQEWLKWQH